ncbi:Hypothetical protein FKW44_003806 [Caligus rogercresseyi]|uniref:Uncharacterized protein n=1 Tax=Caligus rogercresseyi TaxID=217165 RepID=A0A7T8KM48_CALRO|nr:Hypothetical protein FKW44_003806 [Caligus rogercresseyi]
MAATRRHNSSTVLPLDFLHEEAKALNDAQLRTLLYIGLSLSVVILLGLLSSHIEK